MSVENIPHTRYEQPTKEDLPSSRVENSTEQSLSELARQRVGEMEVMVRSSIEMGIERIDSATNIGSDPGDIRDARLASNIVQRITSIHEAMRSLLGKSKREISSLVPRLEEPYFPEKDNFSLSDEEIKNLRRETHPTNEYYAKDATSQGERQRLDPVQARERVNAFKEKLAYQKEGIARMQEDIIATIRKDPDARIGALWQKINSYDKKYNLSEEQYEIARGAVQAYVEKHQMIREIRSQYPDSQRLYEVLFGRFPKGHVRVIAGPMTLCFRCDDLQDYALIRSQAFMTGRDLRDNDIAEASMSGAVSIGSARMPGLQGTILAMNARSGPFDERARLLLLHEEQHAIQRLFSEKKSETFAEKDIVEAETDSLKEQLLYRMLRIERQGAEARAKEEILGHFKEGLQTPEEIVERLTKPKVAGGLYDYLQKYRESRTANLLDILGEAKRPMVEAAVSTVYGSEYRQIIEDGVYAYKALEQRVGYTQEQVNAIFMHEPLSKWRKVAERIFDAKGIKAPYVEHGAVKSVDVGGVVAQDVEKIALNEMVDALFGNDTYTRIYLRTVSGNIFLIYRNSSDDELYIMDGNNTQKTHALVTSKLPKANASFSVLERGKTFKYGTFKSTDTISQIIAVNERKRRTMRGGRTMMEDSTIAQEFQDKTSNA